MSPPTMSRTAAFAWIVGVYAVAAAVALAVASWFSTRPLWEIVALADAAATVVVFGFSVLFDNSSVYDPYWSVAPMVIAPSLSCASASAVPPLRKVLVLVLVLAWGARLTYNWGRNWRGFSHEDWRYVEYRKPGRPYWLVSFLGFHLLPTIWVYLG